MIILAQNRLHQWIPRGWFTRVWASDRPEIKFKIFKAIEFMWNRHLFHIYGYNQNQLYLLQPLYAFYCLSAWFLEWLHLNITVSPLSGNRSEKCCSKMFVQAGPKKRLDFVQFFWSKPPQLTFTLNNQVEIPMTMNKWIFWVDFPQITIWKLIRSPPQRRARNIKSI